MAKTIQCECGHIMGEACQWSGDVGDTVVVEWMPDHLRASHEAAGNTGEYPHNGAERLRLSRGCASHVIRHDPEWTSEVGAR